MALHGNGKSAGKTGGGWSKTDAVEAEIFGAGVDMDNSVDRLFLRKQHPPPDAGRLTGFWRKFDLVCCRTGRLRNRRKKRVAGRLRHGKLMP